MVDVAEDQGLTDSSFWGDVLGFYLDPPKTGYPEDPNRWSLGSTADIFPDYFHGAALSMRSIPADGGEEYFTSNGLSRVTTPVTTVDTYSTYVLSLDTVKIRSLFVGTRGPRYRDSAWTGGMPGFGYLRYVPAALNAYTQQVFTIIGPNAHLRDSLNASPSGDTTFNYRYPDNAVYAGNTCATFHNLPTYRTVYLNFSTYYLQENCALAAQQFSIAYALGRTFPSTPSAGGKRPMYARYSHR